MIRRLPDAEREDVEPAAHRLGAVLEADRLAGLRHPSIRVDPVLLERGDELPRRATDGISEARLPREDGIRLEEPIVHRTPSIVEQHLDDAEPFIKCIEERPVARVALPARG